MRFIIPLLFAVACQPADDIEFGDFEAWEDTYTEGADPADPHDNGDPVEAEPEAYR